MITPHSGFRNTTTRVFNEVLITRVRLLNTIGAGATVACVELTVVGFFCSVRFWKMRFFTENAETIRGNSIYEILD